MKIKFLALLALLVILTTGAISAADNTDQSDVSSDDLVEKSDCGENLPNSDDVLADENDDLTQENQSYDGKYYLFRPDCWTINNNFESSAAVTSESLNDLTVTGTFRTQNDLVGLYWYSQDPIQHPYITYGNRSDYSDVILEFDYEMTGCQDFSLSTFTIASNSGETYYFSMNRFIDNNHVKLDFNNLTLLAGNVYIDINGQAVNVISERKVDVTDLKYIMFSIIPEDYNGAQYNIIENRPFSVKISDITVLNGEISAEYPALKAHQYSLCEDYDDSYNLNPYRLSREMRKLGYASFVDFYIGASYYYEKSGNPGDVIGELNLNHNRTEKMTLDKNVALNNAFATWLDCYCRELKNNGIENIIISLSMENLQCPQSWRQMDLDGNFAMSGWQPSTFLLSPCHEDVIPYMQNVSEACLDIVAANKMKPILQMGETWWWWSESALYLYDNSTKEKYLHEFGTSLPEYRCVNDEYDKTAIDWLNQQLVLYSDGLRDVVKGKYADGAYMALFYPPSVVGDENIPQMITDLNYLKDAYSPNKLDILQIEDYDWVISQNSNHEKVYAIGEDLGFTGVSLHYFAGFVENPEDADTYWKLIEQAMENVAQNNFSEVFVWAGTQLRRDNKILGYDEYVILHNIQTTNRPGIISPLISIPEYVSAGENFTVKMHTDDWVSGFFNVYQYENGKKGELLASNPIINGNSSVILSQNNVGLTKFYLEFDYIDGGYHLIEQVRIIENSKNISVDISEEVETGSDANVSFKAPAGESKYAYITVDENTTKSYPLENGEFKTSISNLSDGYHTVLLRYNDGYYDGDRLTGEVYYKTFTVKVGVGTVIETEDVNTTYASNESLIFTLKDSAGNALSGVEVQIVFSPQNSTYIITTDNEGMLSLPITFDAGSYQALISFAGDDIYLSASTTSNIEISKLSTQLISSDMVLNLTRQNDFVAALKDNNGNALSGADITITLNGDEFIKTTNESGQITLPLNLNVGTYTCDISFSGSQNYESANTTVQITVLDKISAKLYAPAVSATYGYAKNLVITLKDEKGNAMAHQSIKITLNKIVYSRSTDANGQVKLSVSLAVKQYVASIVFTGDDIYKSASGSAKIVVKKATPKLTSSSKSFRAKLKTKKVTATLKNNNKAIKNVVVKLTVNKKTYKVKTNSKGVATFKVKLTKKGKYTAVIKYAGSSNFKSVSKKVKITIR